MQKCPEFSRLPKAGPLKSLNFRRTTPGSIAPMFGHHSVDLGGPINPEHPVNRIPTKALLRQMPYQNSDGFTIRMYPKDALAKPALTYANPPFKPPPEHWPGGRRLNVSVVRIIGKSVHKSSLIRRKLGNKLQTALSMIVTRGAGVRVDKNGKNRITFRGEDIGEKWVASNWTYILVPNLELYNMPYEKLIARMRLVLPRLKQTAETLDAKWGGQKKEVRKTERVPPPPQVEDWEEVLEVMEAGEDEDFRFKEPSKAPVKQGLERDVRQPGQPQPAFEDAKAAAERRRSVSALEELAQLGDRRQSRKSRATDRQKPFRGGVSEQRSEFKSKQHSGSPQHRPDHRQQQPLKNTANAQQRSPPQRKRFPLSSEQLEGTWNAIRADPNAKESAEAERSSDMDIALQPPSPPDSSPRGASSSKEISKRAKMFASWIEASKKPVPPEPTHEPPGISLHSLKLFRSKPLAGLEPRLNSRKPRK